MTNCPFEDISEINDVQVLNAYQALVIDKNADKELFLKATNHIARDHARTPMQWQNTQNAGFTVGDKTWLKVNPNYAAINVADARKNTDSVWHFYKKMIQFRKNNPVLVYGSFEDLAPMDENVYAFSRTLGDDKLLVVCNFSDDKQVFNLRQMQDLKSTTVLISNYLPQNISESRYLGTEGGVNNILALRPYEATVFKLQS